MTTRFINAFSHVSITFGRHFDFPASSASICSLDCPSAPLQPPHKPLHCASALPPSPSFVHLKSSVGFRTFIMTQSEVAQDEHEGAPGGPGAPMPLSSLIVCIMLCNNITRLTLSGCFWSHGERYQTRLGRWLIHRRGGCIHVCRLLSSGLQLLTFVQTEEDAGTDQRHLRSQGNKNAQRGYVQFTLLSILLIRP